MSIHKPPVVVDSKTVSFDISAHTVVTIFGTATSACDQIVMVQLFETAEKSTTFKFQGKGASLKTVKDDSTDPATLTWGPFTDARKVVLKFYHNSDGKEPDKDSTLRLGEMKEHANSTLHTAMSLIPASNEKTDSDMHVVVNVSRMSLSIKDTSAMSSKMILVFCDGTSQDGLLTNPDNDHIKRYPSNLFRLARAVESQSFDGGDQIVFYQDGIGSEADFQGNPVEGTQTIRMVGTAAASKIREAYAFISQNFQDGDEIAVFGYSRGAYTARKVAGLIVRSHWALGASLGHFFTIWSQLLEGKTPDIPPGTRFPRIKCVGVWETVASIYRTTNALSIKDDTLPACIDLALHALALHENRSWFLPTLWTVPANGLRSGQVLKQVYGFRDRITIFGGVFERHDLADLHLFWMAGEISSIINLDLEFLEQGRQKNPEPWGESQPRNEWIESGGQETENRLESGQITKTSLFHQSVLHSPTMLMKPENMVTLDLLKVVFGEDWVPTVPPLTYGLLDEVWRENVLA